MTDEIETSKVTFNTSDSVSPVAVTEPATTSLKADSITPFANDTNVMRNATATTTNAVMGLMKASPNVSRKIFGNSETVQNKTDETALSQVAESPTTNTKSLKTDFNNDKPEIVLNKASESQSDLNNANASSDNDLNKVDENSANAIAEASLNKESQSDLNNANVSSDNDLNKVDAIAEASLNTSTISDTTGSSQITLDNSTVVSNNLNNAISNNTDEQAQNKANKIIRFSEEVKNDSSGTKPSFR